MHFRIDTATNRIKHASTVPFTAPLAAGEADVERTVPQTAPAAADGRRNWTWCRVTDDNVEVDPAAVPAIVDPHAALKAKIDAALADLSVPQASKDVYAEWKMLL